MTLEEAKRGQKLVVTGIGDETVRVLAIRFGICEGVVVTCREVIPAGPVIISLNKQEIAVGRSLARLIEVKPC